MLRKTQRLSNTKLIQTDGTPYKKKYDPRAWLRAGEVSMVERLDEAFQDLGSVGGRHSTS